MKRRSLRVRVALNFAWFGALVSLLLSVGIFFSVHDLGQRLMYETLHAEMQDYQLRQDMNANAMLPATLTLSGYALDDARAEASAPPALARLAPGKHTVEFNGTTYLALVGDHNGRRLAFLFNETLHQQREHHFLYYLLAGIMIMTGLSAMGGLWLARRVVAPVTDLAERVASLDPTRSPPPAPPTPSRDEIDELANAFNRYQTRIQECVERERAFTSDVSHELRTPLAIIRGAVEILEDDANLNSGQRQRIARIERASHDMTDLTSALLHLARAGSRPDAEPDHCSIAEVVRESVDKHRTLSEDRPVEIRLELDHDITIPVEKILATVVVDNLIDNAIRHAGSSQVCVRLEDHRLVVSDTGKGIAESELDRVFHRHYKGSDSNGAGIGLSLVKRICDLRGWRIAIDSKTGYGTAAVLYFTKN
ncbi:MAG: HAMP domain-containing sensor histidine kinase [Gallionellaceae bacterium]|nr:HAMP domain-containing sensor histidine kinase [Gallionellaceae bacterium]MDD5366391.1 HAMP domain-containing sensor histidine kinase [Gallionellaceae bacterium]